MIKIHALKKPTLKLCSYKFIAFSTTFHLAEDALKALADRLLGDGALKDTYFQAMLDC